MIYSDRCAICREERSGKKPLFLLAENSLEDKLTILHWNAAVASREGIQVACGFDHVEQLAVLWMTTGRLDYPFARTALGAAPWRHITRPNSSMDLSGGRQITELAVHRESVERLMTENPQSLKGILDALITALRQEIGDDAPGDPTEEQNSEEENSLCAVLPERKY